MTNQIFRDEYRRNNLLVGIGYVLGILGFGIIFISIFLMFFLGPYVYFGLVLGITIASLIPIITFFRRKKIAVFPKNLITLLGISALAGAFAAFFGLEVVNSIRTNTYIDMSSSSFKEWALIYGVCWVPAIYCACVTSLTFLIIGI